MYNNYKNEQFLFVTHKSYCRFKFTNQKEHDLGSGSDPIYYPKKHVKCI